ncbi:MAG: hypothetical protein IJT41_09770 [Clostridia bacterium]|nr:hypothetical protein [Clostridia bacterium]
MDWIICFFLSLALLIAAAICVTRSGRFAQHVMRRIRSPINILFAGVLLSALIIFIPVYVHMPDAHISWIQAVLLSIHAVLRVFVMDGELAFVLENIGGIPDWLYSPYFLLSAVLFLLAPLMTLGFVLSFFKDVSARMQLLFSRNMPLCVFSELNTRSLSLAQDLLRLDSHRRIIFADVFEQNEESSFEMAAAVRKIGAICFRDDITLLPLHKHNQKKPMQLFIMGNDESENLSQAIQLIEAFRQAENTELYVFCKQPESEMLLSQTDFGKMIIHRINVAQSLILHELNENGMRLFRQAIELPDYKLISVVLIGLDDFGTQMLHTLPWYCQMIGYRVHIHVFDADPLAEAKLRMQCPELLDEAHNDHYEDDGEAQYTIRIHAGVCTQSIELSEYLDEIEHVSEVFISQGDDSRNIRLAAVMRTYFERRGIHPHLTAVVGSSEKKASLQDARNYANKPFDIEYIADEDSIYTEAVLIRSELELNALRAHERWGDEASFWRYDYYRRSSIARAIHIKVKRECGVPGIHLPIEQRTPEQLDAIRRLEHRRWNAYMRSEGYIYSGSREKSSRNDLGKMHPDLVTFDMLSPADQRKDDE